MTDNPTPSRRMLLLVVVLAALATVAIAALLINIFERKQEAKNPFYRVVALDDTIDDPAIWGKNFPMSPLLGSSRPTVSSNSEELSVAPSKPTASSSSPDTISTSSTCPPS